MDAYRDSLRGGRAAGPTYDGLLEENLLLRQHVVQHRRRIAHLERQIEDLSRLFEKLQAAGRRQAARFRSPDQPATTPKKPGRKPGRRHGRHAHRSPPPRIDETYRVPLPKACPHCGSRGLRKTWVVSQYQTEIPRQVPAQS